jgi:hypothetical protein
MNAIAKLGLPHQLSELEDMRLSFVASLSARASEVAQYALAAWDSWSAEEINNSLELARDILQQISQTAISIGYIDLGVTAHHCAAQMSAHLEGDYADLAVCPGEIIWFVDIFVKACNAIEGAG